MSFLRTIEKGIRRSTLKLLRGSGQIGPDDSLPTPLPERPRILLIRIDRIGDTIISTPILRSLRARFPEGRIDLLHGEKNRAVAPLLPYTDNLYGLPKRTSGALQTIRHLRKNRYDAVVNLHLNKSASASLISQLVRGNIVIESAQENAFADAVKTGSHVVTMTARLLKPFGVEPITEKNEQDHPLELKLPPDSILRASHLVNRLHREELKTEESGRNKPEKEREIVLMNISTTHLSRNWLTEYTVATAQLLRKEGLTPVICGAPGDAEQVREIAERSGAQALPPLKRYADFAAVAAQADAVLTPDTSTVHLAAALDRPTIALYASEQMARAWRPWGVPCKAFLQPDVQPDGTEKITPETAVAAVRELLKEQRARHKLRNG